MTVAPIAFAGLMSFLQSVPAPLQIHTYSLAGWRLTAERDTFNSQLVCQLQRQQPFSPAFSVEHAALLIHFSKSTDTFRAWYKLDDGAPQRASDDHAALVSGGALARVEALDNETGGTLAIPLAKLDGVQSLQIQIKSYERPRTYDLRPLRQILASARGLGCKFEGSYGRGFAPGI